MNFRNGSPDFVESVVGNPVFFSNGVELDGNDYLILKDLQFGGGDISFEILAK